VFWPRPLAYLALRSASLLAENRRRGRGPAASGDRTAPGQAGWDIDALAAGRALTRNRSARPALLLVQHGRNRRQLGADIQAGACKLYSVRKSLLSALIGVAVAEGKINLDATAGLARHRRYSARAHRGREAGDGSTIVAVAILESITPPPFEMASPGHAPARSGGSHPPGTFWYYNNWDFNVLCTIYETRCRNLDLRKLPAAHRRSHRHAGLPPAKTARYVHPPKSPPHRAYPFHMSAPRPWRGFGLLFLSALGALGATHRSCPLSWVRESTGRLFGNKPWGTGYGYMWWTGFPRPARRHDGYGARWILGPPEILASSSSSTPQTISSSCIKTDTARVGGRQMGHLRWLLLNAARVSRSGQGIPLRRGSDWVAPSKSCTPGAHPRQPKLASLQRHRQPALQSLPCPDRIEHRGKIEV